jgi:PAS domain S-box-containing protein
VDSHAHARQLRQSWERLLAARELRSESGPEVAGGLRQPIVESWKRSLATGLDPTDLLAPIEVDESEVIDRWLDHPLASLTHVLTEQLGKVADESRSMVVVTDATGLVLHRVGDEWLKERAAEMNLVEGARYSEAADGTNGIGTALAADHAFQVFAFEHFNERHHEWVCSGAPVHDPVSGRIVGLVDLSSLWRMANPRSLELVAAATASLERGLLEARRDQDARLRRRYGDLMKRGADLLVNRDGYVLAGSEPHSKRLEVPEGGGEVGLDDGSAGVAEPLGHGEAYLVRSTGPRGFGARSRNAKRGQPGGDSDQRVSAYFEAALDCVVMADASGRVVEFNPAAERTFGYSRDEALGRTMAELIVPPSLRERHSTAFARFIETGHGTMLGRRLELTGMRADGSEFPVELALSQVEADPFLICGALRDISAAKEADRHLRELADEQAALRRVATLVARESLPQQLFAIVAEQVARIIDVPLVRLVRYESDGSAAELIGGWGESVDPLALGTRWRLDGPSVLASVWGSGRPARLDDYTDLPGQAAVVVRQAGMRSAVASPITVGGRLWGAIAVLSPRGEPLPESTEARLADFTELVATALANAESRAELADSEARARKLAEEQAALRRVATLVAEGVTEAALFAAVAEEVSRVLGIRMVTIDRYESDGASTVLASLDDPGFPVGSRWPLDGPSLGATVLRTGRPARVDDYSGLESTAADAARKSSVTSTVGVPILVSGAVFGVVCVGTAEANPLPPDTEERLAAFTELLGLAVANTDARNALGKLIGEQAALRRVATLVAEGAATAALFSAVTEEVAGLFEPAFVTLLRYEGDVCTVLAATGIGVPVGSRWPLDIDSLAARVYTAGRAVHVANYKDIVGATPREMWEGHPSESDLGVPIVVDGSLWGVFCVATPELDRNPSETADRIGRFTELVATAIGNSEARDGLGRLASEQAALRRVATLVAENAAPTTLFSAVAEEISRLFDVGAVTVNRYDGDACVVVADPDDGGFPVGSRWLLEGDSLAARVLLTGRPARIDDYSQLPGTIAAALRETSSRSAVGVPIVVDGSVWGVVCVGAPQPAQIPPDVPERIARFTELVATAISNATIRTDLIASRARVVAAADETRRRIERDLHDGAQQQLVTVALGLRAMEARIPAALVDVRAEVGRAADRLTSLVEELREMSRGIHPAILTEGGLVPALEALALRSVVPVKLEVCCGGRLPEPIEVAAYYVVSEALTNAAKHANASYVELDLRAEEALSLTIRDDGVGGADASGGSGLVGLKDRVEALGGTIEVTSAPANGTRLDVEIPLSADRSADSALQPVRRV